MTVKTEEKILKKLDLIERLLVRVVSFESELDEDDVLAIAREGREENRTGKTKEFDDLIAGKYPHLLFSS